MDPNNSTSQVLIDAVHQQVLLNPIITGVCGTLISIVLYDFWFRHTHAYKTLKNMPGPMIIPLLGNAHLVMGLTNSGE